MENYFFIVYIWFVHSFIFLSAAAASKIEPATKLVGRHFAYTQSLDSQSTRTKILLSRLCVFGVCRLCVVVSPPTGTPIYGSVSPAFLFAFSICALFSIPFIRIRTVRQSVSHIQFYSLSHHQPVEERLYEHITCAMNIFDI